MDREQPSSSPVTGETAPPRPTPGRIVLYTLDVHDGVHMQSVGKARPAMVVQAFPGDLVNLTVFLDGLNDSPVRGDVSFVPLRSVGSADHHPNGAPGTWRWPERG